jgi:hypothetical protein
MNASGPVKREIYEYNGLCKESCVLWRRLVPRTSDICYCGEQQCGEHHFSEYRAGLIDGSGRAVT